VVVAPLVVLEAGAELDATVPDPVLDPDTVLTVFVDDVSDEVVCEDEVDADIVVLKPTVEATVEVIVN
jgi:hypothetical protein